MFQSIHTSLGLWDLYDVAQIAGAVCSVLVQMILLYICGKKIRYMWFAACYGLYSFLGGYAGALIRNLTFPDRGVLLWEKVSEGQGKHFIGTVMICSLLAVPISLGLGKLLKLGKNRYHDMCIILNALSIGLLIQHIFGRVGCFCRGCCYGIPCSGWFSVKFKYSEVSYSVFPSQLFEIVIAIFLLFIVVALWRHKKIAFGYLQMGFGLMIFISEFFMDKRGTVQYMQMSVIQFFALGLMLLGGMQQIYLKKIR